MKKKLMMVAVLFGALSLGACVDDNESQSVTAVRNAKAEQLKAMAAMYNAQAEAALIQANAEKALKEAKAAYQQALAEAELADAEWRREQTEQAKQRFAVEIDSIKAEAEKAIAAAKLQAAKDEQKLLDLADERVQQLYADYKIALEDIIELQESKIQLTTNISKAEAGLVPFQTLKENQIADLQKQIDMEEYKITLYNEYKGADLVELKKAAEKANQAWQAAEDAMSKARAANDEANNAYYAGNARFYKENDVTDPINTVVAAKELSTWFDGIEWNYWDIITIDYKKLSESKSIPYYTLKASIVEESKQRLERNVKDSSDRLGTDKDDATKTTLYGWLANVTKQRADALAADPKADVTNFDSQIAQLTADIVTEKENLKKAEDTLAKFNSLIASFAGDDLKAYDDAVAALTKLAEAYEKAHDAYIDAQTARNKAKNEYRVAETLVNQTDVESLIAECQRQIAEWQIEQQGYKDEVTDKETLIAKYKSELEKIEGEIAAQQAIIDNLKKLIDAAIAEQE